MENRAAHQARARGRQLAGFKREYSLIVSPGERLTPDQSGIKVVDIDAIRERVCSSVAEFGEIPVENVSGNTPLIGPERALKSRQLVEVLLDLEEFAEEQLQVEFNWTTDSAMSPSQSIYRDVDSLARHLFRLQP